MKKTAIHSTDISHEELGLMIQMVGKGAGVNVKGLNITPDDDQVFKLTVTSDLPFPNLKEMFRIEEVEQREHHLNDDGLIEKSTKFSMNSKPWATN